MFTIAQIDTAHDKIKSGAGFPSYIKEIKQLGVVAFETLVKDSCTNYFGADDFITSSLPKYADLAIVDNVDNEKFAAYLKIHQQGETDYYTFCTHCAETGVEKWIVLLDKMTCTYFDKEGKKVLEEKIPQ